jgi:hypothetical protein
MINLATDKIKYYTNILISGSIVTAPLAWLLFNNSEKNYDLNYILLTTALFLSGRICLEIALFVESRIIDNKVSCNVNKPNHYILFPEVGNKFNDNWYSYLKKDNFKAAHEVIAHIVDRILFLLSSSIALIIAFIVVFITHLIPQDLTLYLLSIVIVYGVLAYRHCVYLATGIDYLRYLMVNAEFNN